MAKFLTPLDMELVTDANGMPMLTRQGRQLYRLLSDFLYQSDVAGLIESKKGRITDLASQPQLLMSLFGEIGQQASVPHDEVYESHIIPRALADSMLYEAMILTGIPKWKAWCFYIGVRIGGGSHWKPSPPPANVMLTAS